MNKHRPSFCNKVKAVILLLCLFFMMAGTCPVRAILSSAFVSSVETSKPPNSAKAFVGKNLSCPFEGQISQATFLDFSKTNNNNSLPLPFILVVLNLYLFVSILNSGKGFITKYRDPSFIYNVLLFLKNRSIII